MRDGGGDHCRASVNWDCGMAVVAAAWDVDKMVDIADLQPSRNERRRAMVAPRLLRSVLRES